MSKSACSPPKQPEETSIWLDIENKLKSRSPLTFSICKVPECIRSSDPDAYRPQVVSIGPYHHGDQGLEAMEDCKWRYLARIHGRKDRNGRPSLLEECVEKLKGIEDEARNCYAGDLTVKIHREHLFSAATVVEGDHLSKKIRMEDLAMKNLTMKNLTVKTEMGNPITLGFDRGELLMNTNKFVEMLLLDGCFLIGFLRLDQSLWNDDVFKNTWTWKRVALDVLLLENQLPFVVLESLFTILYPQMTGAGNLKSTSCKFFQDNLLNNMPLQEEETGETEVQHLLHFIHMSLPSVPSSSSDNQNNQTKKYSLVRWICHPLTNFISTWRHDKEDTEPLLGVQSRSRDEPSSSFPCQDPSSGTSHPSQQIDETQDNLNIPSVTKLSGAGVKFEIDRNMSFFDVGFDKGKMKMGQLQVDDYTNRIFRNFIAFEQCLPAFAHNPVFSNYCCFIDSLVNTARDVEILEDCCIIENLLGSNEELAAMFNKLGDGVAFDVEENHYLKTSKEVDEYINKNWPRWRAKFVGDYFSNPWAAISLGAAILLFIVGIVQFIFSILSFFKG